MFRRDILVILLAALAVGILFGYHAINGTEVPIWQALAVGVVNLMAAGKLFLTVKKARQQGERPPREGQR
ncbi:MAG TPA: hypothetical protein PL143_05515 [Rhodocyclaceae bacterium]|nr:hypothetical protein [Rhodocyclaceae bacterium]